MAEIFKDWPRFDGAVMWATLTAEQQAQIGAAALDWSITCIGEDSYFGGEAMLEGRPFIAAHPLVTDKLLEVVQDAIIDQVPAIGDDTLPIPIPLILGAICRRCGCSHQDPCEEGCSWAEPDLCTACLAMAPKS